MRRPALVAFLALALAGTASAGVGVQFPNGPDPAVAEWPSWPYPTSCGGLTFDPAAAFGGPTGAESGPGAPEAALRSFLEAGVYPEYPQHYWRLVAASDTTAEFVSGRLSTAPYWLSFEKAGGVWGVAGMGSCRPHSVRDGLSASPWGLDHPGRPGPSTRTIRIQVVDGGCNGGNLPNSRVQEPALIFGRDKVLITLWVTPLPPGKYTCKRRKNPPPYLLRLSRRLGDRTLWDASTYPPRQVPTDSSRLRQ